MPGEVPANDRRAIAAALLSGIERWYPGAARSAEQIVDAGAIVAYGASDVDDPASACMPAWNAAAFIGPVLASLAAQTYPALSLLISATRAAMGRPSSARRSRRRARGSG